MKTTKDENLTGENAMLTAVTQGAAVDGKKEYLKAYAKRNRESINERRRINYHLYYKHKQRDINIKYAKKARKKINLYFVNKKKQNVNFRITMNLRSRVGQAIKYNAKNTSTKKILGCTIEFLKQYLQDKFTDGMSWDNYGKWHIDHIIPCNNFNMTNEEQQQKCFHYTNLQPLWARDNLSKGCRLGAVAT
jgi:hypothetical protein